MPARLVVTPRERFPGQPEPAELAPPVTPLRGGTSCGRYRGRGGGVSQSLLLIFLYFIASPPPRSGSPFTVKASGGTAGCLPARL